MKIIFPVLAILMGFVSACTTTPTAETNREPSAARYRVSDVFKNGGFYRCDGELNISISKKGNISFSSVNPRIHAKVSEWSKSPHVLAVAEDFMGQSYDKDPAKSQNFVGAILLGDYGLVGPIGEIYYIAPQKFRIAWYPDYQDLPMGPCQEI